MRITPLALVELVIALALLAAGHATAAADPPVVAAAAAPAAASASSPASAPAPAPAPAPVGTAALQSSPSLVPLPRGVAARQQPIVLQARSISGQPDLEAHAEGDVEFRRGGLVIHADRLTYDSARDLASARGQVRIQREGAIYWGPLVELEVQRFQGFFLEPRFEFTQLGSGGKADRIDFVDSSRSTATNASYTSCPRDGPQEPAWVLQTRRVRLDLERNEGVAEGAVLRFLGTPILALPILSFPLGDGRKSGWLPPSINIDNRSGIELAVPYYWNIAPNRDATLVPRVLTRRGLGVDAEFRYLEPTDQGTVGLEWLPDDLVAKASREAVRWQHSGSLRSGLRYSADLVRVSDDDWWKDFPNASRSFTPRLLPLRGALEQPFRLGDSVTGADGLAYARLVRWQVLQGTDSAIASPYERSPQVGVRLAGDLGRWQVGLETEYNRFTLPDGEAARAGRFDGQRVHLLASVSRPFREPSGWLIPKLTVNAASYDTDDPVAGGTRRATRTIPTFSVDTGFELERRTQLFGRELQQTLEPRLLYVNTPYRAQSQLPNYDSAAKDFNVISLFSENTFSGIDRVADAHQVTAGFTTRLLDVQSGNEALRLGVVQRYLLRSQQVAARADGSLDGPPLTQKFSDVLLAASTGLVPNWGFDAAVQYSPEISRSVRSIVSARYSPGPFRTVGATYRLARGYSETVEVGWQWPIGKIASAGGMAAIAVAQSRVDRSALAAAAGQGSCSGAWYTVGRFNYSMTDARVTDSVLGLEYDAGCWIGRVVAERLSTGRSEATTRLLLQLELVGLSRLGSNPLKVLKENIPGYRLLREDRGSTVGSVQPEWQPPP